VYTVAAILEDARGATAGYRLKFDRGGFSDVAIAEVPAAVHKYGVPDNVVYSAGFDNRFIKSD
jgi:hypothetical protein